jgi:type IX secretion system PorP/SprF family membrane protein
MPNESFLNSMVSKLPVLYKAHGGIEATVSSHINISPNFLVAYQNNQLQVNVGTYATYMFSEQKSVLAPTAFLLGGWYRLQDAYILSAGLGNSFYTIGFSYDVNSSNLRYNTNGRGAYEISLKIRKPQKRKAIYQTPRI